MKQLLTLAFLFCALLSSATTTVTGKIQNLGTGNVTSGAFVRFWLRGCSGNQPRVNGTSVIGPSQGGVYFYDIAADGSGNVSGTVFSTRDITGLLGGDIECGGSLTAVWYGMQIFSAGKGGPETPVHAKNGATLDITNVTPITTNPVVTAPTGDSIYARLDAGNQPFTGNVQAPIFNAITGFRLNSLAPSAHVLRGNGTNYVDGQVAFSELTGSAACSQLPALTGDITSSSCATTLATVNSGPGACGDSTHICQVTTNGKGLVTAQTPVSIALPAVATLNKQDPQISATTGNGTNQTVYTYSMPGGALASGKCLDISFTLNKVSGANTLNAGIFFGATQVALLQPPGDSNNDPIQINAKVCNNTGSTTAQWATATALDFFTTVGAWTAAVTLTAPAENTGSPVVIKGIANVASPDTWQGEGWTVITEP